MSQEGLQSAMYGQVMCSYFVVFIFDWRHSLAATAFTIAAWLGQRLLVRWPYIVSGKLGLNSALDLMAIVMLSIALGTTLVAKFKIEASEKLLIGEVIHKEQQVLQERVKRCELEFKIENMTAAPDRPQTGPHSVPGSSALSSSAAFQMLDDGAGGGSMVGIVSLGQQEHWTIPTSEIMLYTGKVLGMGSFGVVVAGSFVGSPVAVKVAKVDTSTSCLPALSNELRILRHVRHPNVALFHGACFDSAAKVFAIILELVDGLDLKAYLEKDGRACNVSDSTRCILLLQMARAINYLHTRMPPIIHGDLKPSNMLVEQLAGSPRVKLLDFGLSRLAKAGFRPLGGTLAWMAPEVQNVCLAAQSVAADAYSYGLVAFFVTTGQEPPRAHVAGTSPLTWPPLCRFARLCRQVAEWCTAEEPTSRPRFAEVVAEVASWPATLGLPEEHWLGLGRVDPLPWQQAWPQVQLLADRPTDGSCVADGGSRSASAWSPSSHLGSSEGSIVAPPWMPPISL